MNKKHWEYFVDVSDSIARIIKLRFGVTTMWSDEISFKDDEKAMFENMLMSRGHYTSKIFIIRATRSWVKSVL